MVTEKNINLRLYLMSWKLFPQIQLVSTLESLQCVVFFRCQLKDVSVCR